MSASKIRIFSMLFALSVMAASCGFLGRADRVEYDFDDGPTARQMIMAIPPGFQVETHNRDQQGNLVRSFRYADGSELYIACREASVKPVLEVENNEQAYQALVLALGDAGQGELPDGTRWKRIRKEGFMVGYHQVDPTRTGQFDRALQSFRIR